MTEVNKESLAAKIASLEAGPRTLKEHYTLIAFKMLLETMDSKPVAWLAIYHGEVYDDAIGITRSVVEAQADRFGWELALTEIIPLYRHAQQPVVPEEATTENIQVISGALIPRNGGWYKMDENECHMAVDVWNACRAVMLQGAETAESRCGIQTAPALDSLPKTGEVLPTNSPVIPDEMTPEMMRAVQLNSELGAYAAANLAGAYDLFREFWEVAMKAARPAPVVQELDEREAFEAFMEGRFGDTVDRRRAKNGDQGYMAWDMVVAWVVWEARAHKP